MEKKSVMKTAFSELIGGGRGEGPQLEGSLAWQPGNDEPPADGNITHIGGNVRPCSTISREMTIDGSIETEGDIIMSGKIKGNIKCGGKLTLYGQIEGNIDAQEIVMAGARVRGVTICSTGVMIDSATTVVGNIECTDITLEGRVEGDIAAVGNATLKSTAYLLGDLQLSGLAVEMGARIIGRVTTKDAPPAPTAPAGNE